MTLKPDQELLIKKSNELVQARYKLSLEEQRFILNLASYIHKDDEDFKSYEIRVADFVKMFGLEKRKAIYKAVEEAAKELVGKRIELSRDGKKIYASWLSYAEYVEGSGVIKVEFHSSLKPYLLQLKENILIGNIEGFVKYPLSTVVNFKSSYSIRLYELLKMEVWKAEKEKKKQFEKVLTIEEYRSILGLEKKNYPIFADLKRWVIEPPVREVSDKTELNIFETRYIKTGKKITSICFVVLIRTETETQLRQDNLRIDDIEPEPQKEEDHPIIQALMSHGFTWENARTFKNKYGIKKIERTLAYMKAERANGKKIVSEASYIVKAVQEDWGLALEQEKEKQAETRKRIEKEAQEKKEREDREKEIIAEKHKQALDVYNKSPDFIKKMILDSFNAEVLQENKILLDGWKTAQKIGADEFLNSPLLRSTFTTFLVNKNFQ